MMRASRISSLVLLPRPGLSLLSDLRALASLDRAEKLPAEHQQAMKLFCGTPYVFELQSSNRFKDPELRDLMNFMRAPSAAIPTGVRRTWQMIQLSPRDPRLREERFQNGHMLAWSWDTVSRWMMMRATRDAKAMGQVLYLVQAADASAPAMPMALAANLMNQGNPGDTGGMHGLVTVSYTHLTLPTTPYV